MEANHNKPICNSTTRLTVHPDLEKNNKEEEEDIKQQQQQEYEILKRRISSHPLYDLLVENHLDCLKVSAIGYEERNTLSTNQQKISHKPINSSFLLHSDLDHFMEAYIAALSKLKEAMQEPQEESLAFVNSMHSQLRDLITPPSSQPPSASSGTINEI
ncbi:hypothetical protein ACFE04_022821 [Oxalis oulophora]